MGGAWELREEGVGGAWELREEDVGGACELREEDVGGVWDLREEEVGGACPMQPLLWHPNMLCWLRGKSLDLVRIYWSGWSLGAS